MIHTWVDLWLAPGGTAVRAMAVNLSRGGLGLQLPGSTQTIEPHQRLLCRIELEIQGTVVPVELSGVVSWINHDSTDRFGQPVASLGIQTIAISPEAEREVDAFVDAYRSTVLVVDDEPDNLALAKRAFGKELHTVCFSSAEQALEYLDYSEVAVALIDIRMPDMDGTSLVEELARRFPGADWTCLAWSAYPPDERVQRTLTEGLCLQLIEKPVPLAVLLATVRQAVQIHELRCENRLLREQLGRSENDLEIYRQQAESLISTGRPSEYLVGNSTYLRGELSALEDIARSGAPVHICGETGTGKELVARALHEHSGRRDEKLLVQNCAATTATLLQSTLFGHRKGAFTGAVRDQVGLFEAASGGTLFLDEVGEMPPMLQAMLLRVLDNGEVTRVGEVQARKVSVRIISATNRDLEAEVQAGRFRSDLYYRLVSFRIEVPPLRERDGDVALLANHFLAARSRALGKSFAGFAPETLRALEHYDWPGNVRQLKNEIERLCVLTPDRAIIERSSLSPAIIVEAENRKSADEMDCSSKSLPEILLQVERRLLTEALCSTNANKTKMAKQLGISRQRLLHRLRRLGLK